jgi:hypothetical protein
MSDTKSDTSKEKPLVREYNTLNIETPYNLCFVRHGKNDRGF